MIQRIQTVFLVGAVISLGILFFIPLGHLITPEQILLDFYFNGIWESEIVENSYHVYPLSSLMILTVALAFVSIFFYKRRVLQMRLNGVNIFLIIGQIGMFLFYFFDAAKQLNAEKEFNISIVLPIVAIVFIYLAIRGIARDEAMVKAADRIR
jgi:glucan phosphoethanolaminetransferase (alkaline phosphatase superfamily)